MFPEILPVPYTGFAGEDVDGAFVVLMQVRLGALWVDCHHVHTELMRSRGLGGNAGEIFEPLLSPILGASFDSYASRRGLALQFGPPYFVA